MGLRRHAYAGGGDEDDGLGGRWAWPLLQLKRVRKEPVQVRDR